MRGAWDCAAPSGRIDSFRDAVRPHFEPLVSVARRILGSHDLAWDAVQEGLVAMWREGVSPRDTRAWLVRSVVFRSLHASRTRRRRRRNEELAGVARAGYRKCDDPTRILERRELMSRLDQAIAGLGADYRAVIELREVDGLEYSAISNRLGIPCGTVRSRLNRARAVLRERLGSVVSEYWNHAVSRRTDHDEPSCIN